MEVAKYEQDTDKSSEKGINKKLAILETALSMEDYELLHQLFLESPTFLATLKEYMLSQEFPDEYFGRTKKLFHSLSKSLTSNSRYGELTVFQLHLALIFLELELNQPKWYSKRRNLEFTFSTVVDALLDNSATLNRILVLGDILQDQRICEFCESSACISQINHLVHFLLVQLFDLLSEIVSSEFEQHSQMNQKLLTFAYFGLDTKMQSLASSARTLITVLFEVLPASQSEIMWRAIYSIFEAARTLQFGQCYKPQSAPGHVREEISNVLRLLNICGCYACNFRRRNQNDEGRRGCCLQDLKMGFFKETAEDLFCTEMASKCDILVAYLQELLKNGLSSWKKRAILSFVESILALFPDLLFPSAFFVVASLFQWCLEVLKTSNDNSQMRIVAVEILTKISVRLLEIQMEHRECKICSVITEHDRVFVLFDTATFHLEKLAQHSLGCWVTVLSRVSKKMNIIFEETAKHEELNPSKAPQLTLNEIVPCSAASCSLTKTGPLQTVEALFSVLAVAGQQERQKLIRSLKYILKADPKFFVELSWVENALLLLSRNPVASVRAVSMELGLEFINVHLLSHKKSETSLISWKDIVVERLLDSSSSVRKVALCFAKVLLVFYTTTNVSPDSLLLRKKILRSVVSRLEDEEEIVRESCMDSLEEYFQYAQRKLSVRCGSSYEIVQFYHEIYESLRALKYKSSRKLLFLIVAKVNVAGVDLLENLIKCAMSIVAKTFQNVYSNVERSDPHTDEHYQLATLFLETACEWDPEYTAPYERYLLSCLELSLNSRDTGVHILSNIIYLLSSLYEAAPAGLEGVRKFFCYVERILASNLCPVLGSAVMKSLHKLCTIPTFRMEVEELLHELLTVAKRQTCDWQATPPMNNAQEGNWKVISTIFARIAGLSAYTTSKSMRESIRMAMFWFFEKIFDFLKFRLQSTISFDETWFSTAMEAALIYLKFDCSYVSSLMESITLLLESSVVVESQKLSMLFNLQSILSEGMKDLQSNVSERSIHNSGANIEFLRHVEHSFVDSVTALFQHLHRVFLDLTFSENGTLRKYVCSIICQSVWSGIVVPVEVLPSLFCFIFENDVQSDVRERAIATLKFIAQSQQEVISFRLVEGLHDAWKFWKITMKSDWDCLIEKGSDICLRSRFAGVFSLLSSSQLFAFVRTLLDELISSDENWLFCVFCTVPILLLEPSCILSFKSQRRRSLNVLEEMKLTTDKCMQLVSAMGFDWFRDFDATRSCTKDCIVAIRLYLVILVHEKFQLLIQTWNRADEKDDDALLIKSHEYWNELKTLGSHESHHRICARIFALTGDCEGVTIDVAAKNCDKENIPVLFQEREENCLEFKAISRSEEQS
ncbi:hypothetical protein GpartN1_g536.t1 [Galdieria partita]|uniref:Sister chromatid cohesion C-terminal domain-containing protein n=1 Tax=Galdieria partita TaxID=83374 RepID=A0A9C7PQP9_9RHOD|nr:hypothetical protein GpartN1_g536.t1 [Galdieria partita]